MSDTRLGQQTSGLNYVTRLGLQTSGLNSVAAPVVLSEALRWSYQLTGKHGFVPG